MTMHPYIGIENIRERQREMTAQAERRRLERQLSDMARAPRRAQDRRPDPGAAAALGGAVMTAQW
jgi:hypothetical protein